MNINKNFHIQKYIYSIILIFNLPDICFGLINIIQQIIVANLFTPILSFRIQYINYFAIN